MTHAPRPLAVWTDFGGVLTPPVDVTFREFSTRANVPLHALKEAMRLVGEAHGTDSMGVLDTPMLDEESWSREVEAALAGTFGVDADLSRFGERWFAGRPANADWKARLEGFRAAGAFIGLLSNLPPSWERHRRFMIDDSHFDDIVCSYAVGCRKPEPEIFRIAAARADRAPHECVLVDDVEKNVVGAAAAGWHAVLFHDAAQAAGQVAALLGSAAPVPARSA
ncbi:HAD-IA family hydrolase [Streptomyces sp. SL13]|uniref:HAD-IA family hydrolase n=1 Tax=Streptantibioticus silvisoli TaxID=2705255 RepID=A0AA90K734_9ACTN|nr:HAD-IA family hydrolase [Streptantibioticus silvisoli]MDI5968503.1 HAD-IA family hydrolase [Streptantibioticus silvisoli]